MPGHRKSSRLRSGRSSNPRSPPHDASPLPDLTSSFSSGASSASPNTPDRQRRDSSGMVRSGALAGSSPRSRSRSRDSRDIDNIRRGAEIIREQILANSREDAADRGTMWSQASLPPPLSPRRQARKVQPVQSPRKDIVEDVFALEEEVRMLRMRVRSGGLCQEAEQFHNRGNKHGYHDAKEDYHGRRHAGEPNQRHLKQLERREKCSGDGNDKRSQARDRQASSSFLPSGNKSPPDPPSTYEEYKEPASLAGRDSSFATAYKADFASRAALEEETSFPISHSMDEAAGFGGTSYLPGRLMCTSGKSSSQETTSRPTGRVVEDKAYLHATNAGILWQALVGEQIRFPSHWFDGARTPRLVGDDDPSGQMQGSSSSRGWSYVARCRVRGDPDLNRWVRNRSKPGKILLHVVIRDTLNWQPIRHVAIGCFHPNARGIRHTEEPIPKDENVREVWMAVRKCGDHGRSYRIDTVMSQGMPLSEIGTPSPLGDKHTVHNENVRAVYGDEAPRETVFILEKDLYKIMTDAADDQGNRGLCDFSAALTLLDQFVFRQQPR